jgi:hypothetical protein
MKIRSGVISRRIFSTNHQNKSLSFPTATAFDLLGSSFINRNKVHDLSETTQADFNVAEH